jgi:hypothetical protein
MVSFLEGIVPLKVGVSVGDAIVSLSGTVLTEDERDFDLSEALGGSKLAMP